MSVPPPRVAAPESAREVPPVITPEVMGKLYVPAFTRTGCAPVPVAVPDNVSVLPETLRMTVLAGILAPPMVIPAVMLGVPLKETTFELPVVAGEVRAKASLKLV